ncbi:hypothetical protein IVB41_07270 [Bradyrhizobium sp. 44]|uniref:hypothetical protein n=1 Tax=Bradyrhizobium sp. 44 TaxID=2782675 RepID=UPI001FFC1279|nr:hypothetical protein [Bradyrhizobium sp. 44]MCK1283739.1 hypothetical protein [Bradyrhizobium sp. 44]
MFSVEPITTTNLISIVQIIIVVLGFIFSWKALRATNRSIEVATRSLETATGNLELATSNAQAQLYNQMVLQGRDLQYKFIDIILEGKSEEAKEKRKDQYVGTVISYYSAWFEMRNILRLPQSVTKLIDYELKETMKEDQVRAKWIRIKNNFSKEFIKHVQDLEGV